jgi:hypothetical protein
MKVKLKARGLWAAVEPGGGDLQDDMMALDVLSSAVPPEMVSVVASQATTKGAWDTIKVMRIGDDRVREATTQTLLRQFESATFKEGESMEEFSMRLSGMVQHIATLGETVDETKVVSKFLRSVLHRYKQIVIAIQTLLDVSTLTLVNVTGRLKAAEEELEAPPPTVHHNGKLYLSEEAWEEKWRLCDGEKNPGGGSGGRGGGRNGGRGRGGRGNGGGRDSKGPPSTGPAKLGKNQCKKCFKFGHWGRECRSGHPRKEEAHATQEEEALMLMRATIGANSAAPPASSQRAAVKAVHLREEKVFVQLGAKEERDAKVWICDTGATNHMSGSRAAFADLDLTVCGTVRFGDDSVAEIEGCGSVLIRCKMENTGSSPVCTTYPASRPTL